MYHKIQQLNKISILEDDELVRDSVHTISDVCHTANSSVNEAAQFGCRSYTFLKIRQPNKISIFEAAEFVHGSAHVNKRRLRTQTRRLTRQPYLVAEVIPSFFIFFHKIYLLSRRKSPIIYCRYYQSTLYHVLQ